MLCSCGIGGLCCAISGMAPDGPRHFAVQTEQFQKADDSPGDHAVLPTAWYGLDIVK